MIWLNDAQHGAMIAHKAGVGFDPEVDSVISRVTPEGKLLGGFVYTHFNRRTITMHMAGSGPGWCNLELLWVGFDYPFNQLKVERVLGTVPSTSERVLEMDKRGGWIELCRVPGVVVGGDMVVLSMTREQCKWLKFGRRFQPVGEMAA